MRVLVVSKTHVWEGACVGGVTETGASVRLKQADGSFPDANQYEIGQTWDMDFVARPDKLPHTEDILINRQELVGFQSSLRQHLLANFSPHRGSVSGLYGGHLGTTGNGSCYISARLGVPNYSTGFWVPDVNLRYEAAYYWYGPYRLKYVGFADPIPLIPAGTLVRVSLARWWAPQDTDIEERCYLQLSGWYL